VADSKTHRLVADWTYFPAVFHSGKCIIIITIIIIIIIIVIVVIIIIIISFMQVIFTYIPETNYVPREYSVAAILLL